MFIPVMLALCLMLSMTHYAQNYAGIVGGFLGATKLKGNHSKFKTAAIK